MPSRLARFVLPLAIALPGTLSAQMPEPPAVPATRPPLQLHGEPPPAPAAGRQDSSTPPAGIIVTPLPEAPAPAPSPAPMMAPPAAAPPPRPAPSAVPPSAPPPPAPVPAPAPTAGMDDAVAVVHAFYEALSRADGVAANAYVVPEKRGQGAYDPQGIAAFYGAMSEPLRLLATGRPDERVVRVRYAYTHRSGRRCDGSADVLLAVREGRLLIERIRPLNGC
ncbi:hypothetical protein [Azospirillum halopraeferens]|uniref:hypothetical protein n=1 Tax=Azospirillum halopraeferens TaxID=34010 RepID=UPI00041D913B|nr:hypothetical protein [Azospirillum halopraeferens]